MGLQTLYPAPDYLKKRPKGPAIPIAYPTSLKYFPQVFLKLELFSRKSKDQKNGPLNIIYLPLPNTETFLQRQIDPTYSFKDIGVVGELAIRNYPSIKEGINSLVEGDAEKFADIAGEIYDEAGKEAYSTIKTLLERTTMDAQEDSIRAIKQGLGYGFAPNKILTYNEINVQPNIPLQFRFTPKDIRDARTIEKLMVVFTKATLPYLKKEAFEEVVSAISELKLEDLYVDDSSVSSGDFTGPFDSRTSVDKAIDAINAYLKKDEDGNRLADGESALYATVNAGNMFKLAKRLYNDTIDSTVVGSEQMFSSTFELPNSLRISIMKKPSQDSFGNMEEAIELYRFPVGFFITNILFDRDQERTNMDRLSFLKYENEAGENEYFSLNYLMALTLTEERVVTAEDIYDHSQTHTSKRPGFPIIPERGFEG